MAIKFLEAGTAATYGTEFYDAVTGATGSDSGTVHTGPRSLKIPAYRYAQKDGLYTDAGTRMSYYWRFTALPGGDAVVFYFNDTSAGPLHTLKLKTTGVLQYIDGNGTTHDGATVLSANTWYRISFASTFTSTFVNEMRLWINGSPELTLSNLHQYSGAATQNTFWSTDKAGTDTFLSDVYFDDSSALTDPGDIRVTVKLPAANNTNNFDTAVGANPANRWTNVNERALSLTNGWQHAATTDVQENYTLQTAAVGDVDVSAATLVGRCAWIYAKGAAGGAGTPKLMDNGSESAIVLTSAAALYTLKTASASYPSNAAGIGMRSTNNADDTFLYECGTLIAYTPGAAAPAFTATTRELTLLGVGA